MKKLLRNPLKERKLSDLLSLIMGVLFMIAAIIYVILGNGDRNYSSNVMIMALVSGIAMILGMFVSFSEIRFASALLFIALQESSAITAPLPSPTSSMRSSTMAEAISIQFSSWSFSSALESWPAFIFSLTEPKAKRRQKRSGFNQKKQRLFNDEKRLHRIFISIIFP